MDIQTPEDLEAAFPNLETLLMEVFSRLGTKAHLNDAEGCLTSTLVALTNVHRTNGAEGAAELATALEALVRHLSSSTDKIWKDVGVIERLSVWPVLNMLKKQREAYLNEQGRKEA